MARSAGEDGVDGRDHRLTGIDAGRAEDRHQRLAERIEGPLGFPDVEDVQAVLALERAVVGAAFGGPRAGFVQLPDDVAYFSALMPCTGK